MKPNRTQPITLSPTAFARLSQIDPKSPEGKRQIDVLVEMVTEWTNTNKPNLASRAIKLLAKLEALRDAVAELRVTPGAVKEAPKGDFDALAELLEIALAWRGSHVGAFDVHLKALESFVRLVAAE